jgi:Ca2+-binding RTX toxin-like protein
MKFWAAEDGLPADDEMAELLTRHFVTDQWGNEYVMHASGETGAAEVAQAFEDAVLPAGWTKSSRTLTEDLILNPAEGADGSYHYLVFRDSADNTYHQISWSGRGALAAQVDGMPVWGGQDGDVLTGDADGVRADSIHGAGGGDVLAGWDGADTLWGDAGADTVSGGGGADLLYGNPGADLLNGGADADTLYGGQEADLLEGGAGDDVLYGGLGDDTLSGGTGADTVMIEGTSGADLIADFDGAAGDRVVVAGNANGTALDSFEELPVRSSTSAAATR